MELPIVDKIISDSDLCIITCDDNKRYVGYYRSNGWYVYTMKDYHMECLHDKVIKWEYLNPIEKT